MRMRERNIENDDFPSPLVQVPYYGIQKRFSRMERNHKNSFNYSIIVVVVIMVELAAIAPSLFER